MDTEFTDYEKQLLDVTAQKVSRAPGFGPQDRQDIRQELALALIQGLPQFNPQKAQRSTYAARIVQHQACKLLRARAAAKREVGREGGSMDEFVLDEDGVATRRVDDTAADSVDVLYGRVTLGTGEVVAWRIESPGMLAALPAATHALARRLMQGETLAEAARSMGISRKRLYRSVLPQMRQALARYREQIGGDPVM